MKEEELMLLTKHLVDFNSWLDENRPYHKDLYFEMKDYLARISSNANIDIDVNVLLFRAGYGLKWENKI
jgi:hypothetical protein